MMDSMNAELLLNIVQYGNVADLGNLSACSKRWYYLVKQYVEVLRGPELVSVGRWDPKQKRDRSTSDLFNEARAGLQGAPNLVLAFQSDRGMLEDHIADYVPNNCTILCAESSNIQVNHPAATAEDTPTFECNSDEAVMMGRFPGANIYPFCLHQTGDHESVVDQLKDQIARDCGTGDDSGNADDQTDSFVKAIIIYVCGSYRGDAESVVQTLQAAYPNAAIAGGICQAGYITMPRFPHGELPESKGALGSMSIKNLKGLHRKLAAGGESGGFHGMEKQDLVDLAWESVTDYQASGDKNSLHSMSNHLFGVVLAGPVPIRSVVSRGVTSILQQKRADEPVPTSSPFVVTESRLHRPTDDDYPFRRSGSGSDDDMPSVHLATKICNKETNDIITAQQLFQICQQRETFGPASFIGLKRPGDNGFELSHPTNPTTSMNALLFDMDESRNQGDASLVGAEVDFFCLSGEACMHDMDRTAKQLKEQTKGEEILGAVMFSCSGRGPSAYGMIPEKMSDATRFGNVFKDVPCLGFYAGGEIGPQALAGKENVFQRGRAAMQGFTAVFALFIVPVVDRIHFDLDDRPERVNKFVSEKFGTSAEAQPMEST